MRLEKRSYDGGKQKREDADAMNEIIPDGQRTRYKERRVYVNKYCWYQISKWKKSTLAMIEWWFHGDRR